LPRPSHSSWLCPIHYKSKRKRTPGRAKRTEEDIEVMLKGGFGLWTCYVSLRMGYSGQCLAPILI
jgi:hypothetical protein